jgi:nucleotide-binding universal stress UspA family protein
MEDIKRVLVACRMPEPCQRAVHYGVSLAGTYGADLVVLHVIYEPFIRGDWNLPMQLGVVEEEYKKIVRKAEERLAATITSERKKGIVVRELVREGKPSEEILKVIKEEKIDLLVILTHEETRLEHLLFGRTNDELVRKMPCSILMLKSEPEPVSSE